MGTLMSCQACGASIDRDELISRGLSHCTACGEQLDASLFKDSKLSGLGIPLTHPPLGSRIEIIEADDNRLMLSLPPGGRRSSSLGCFALVWTSFSSAIAVAMVAGVIAEDEFPVAALAIPGLFVLIGIVMTVIWIRMKYTRGYLFLEPHRAVMQTILFNRKKNIEIELDESSFAQLVISYKENDVPVYRVELQGVGKSLSFGTAWERDAKDWYVDTLNSFLAWHYDRSSSTAYENSGDERLGAAARIPKGSGLCPACVHRTKLATADGMSLSTGDCRCEKCGTRLIVDAGQITEAFPQQQISPDSLIETDLIELEKTGLGEWLMTIQVNKSKGSSIAGGCLLLFGIIWEGFIIFWTVGATQAPGLFKIVALCFSLPFHAIGIGLLSLGLYGFFGRFRLFLGRDESWGRWSLGPLRYTRRFRAEAVTEIKLVRGALLNSGKNRTRKDRDSSQSEEFSCILIAAGKTIPVTHGNSSEESRLAAGLVRYCLNDLGIRLQDD
ncbi:MAG TPA: hypothetical protein VLA12_17500 [Planctomycetaceae bacterium]|nr:hypothetical protein [Planctomycetaceae bacterium]